MPKKKHPSLSLARKKAWIQFSIFIRTRDCLRTTMDRERGECCTCSKQYPFKLLQAGHFIDGRNNAVLFSERGVHAQCYACNVRMHGNKVKYWLFMEQYYGRKIIDELILQSGRSVTLKTDDFDRITATYKEKTAKLLQDPSLAKLHTGVDLPF